MKLAGKCILILSVLTLIITPLWGVDESRVQEFTLNNGMRILMYEMHDAQVIYSHLTYNVGSKYEPYGQTGISHIVEHMMFKGTKRFPKGTIAELISANGGIFNAYTSTDITVYYELLPRNVIDLAFDIESERMYKCEFDAEEFKSEVNVIAEERKQRTENSAAGLRREEVNTLIFKNHPYRNPVIGWMEDIRTITRDDAFQYYRTYYTPNNATLVLVGDFNVAEMRTKVEKYFGNIPRGPELPHVRFYRVAQNGKKTLDFKHPDILNPEIQLYFAAPTRADEDGPALYVAGNILGSKSATSRLNKKLHREKQLCESANAGLTFSKDPMTFNVTARLLPEAAMPEVEALIWKELDSLANYPVSEYELQKVKNRINFSELTSNQYCDQIGSQLGTWDNYFGWHYINEWRQRILSVTAEDIQRVVKKYLSPDNLVVCYSRRDTTVSQPPSTIFEQTDLNEETPPILDQPLVEEAAETTADDVRRIYYPKLKEVIAPNPIVPLFTKHKLANDVVVYLIESHDYPTIYLLGLIETGRLPEEVQYPGIRQMVEGLIQRGTAQRKYEQIIEERAFTPYTCDISQSWNRIVLQGYALMKDADKLLNHGYEVLSQPSFPPEEIEKARPLLIKSAREYKETARMKAFYAMFEAVFEGHQYALPYAGSVEAFKQLTREDLINFWNKYYSPERLQLIVVGDFNKTEIIGKLNNTFGKWQKKSGDTNLPFTTIQPIRGKRVFVYGNPEYKQCRLDIAFNPVEGGIRVNNPDLEALELLEAILCGSSLTSRMGKELRDKQGLSYGIRSNLWVREHGGYWNIRTELDKANLNRMVRGIFKEIEKVQQSGVTDEELEKAKARKIAMLTMNTRTLDDVGGLVFNMLSNKQPLDHFDKSRQRILAVTKEDIRRVARKYLDTNNYIIAVSGDIPDNALDEFK